MKPLARRLDDLEAFSGDNLDHLTDQEIEGRMDAVVADMGQHGIRMPTDWQDACRADPAAFARSIRSQVEAML